MPSLFAKILCCLLIVALFGCKESYKTEQFYAMGTFVSITVPEKNADIIVNARSKITSLEAAVKEDTEKFNRNPRYKPRPAVAELIERGSSYELITDGRFSVYAATISKLYGFPEGAYRVPDQSELDTALDNISRGTNVSLDLGAYAKGWIVDEAIRTIKEAGIKTAMVNAGGDLYALGKRPDRDWRVAIQDPKNSRDYISIVNLENMAVATSGDYERAFKAPDGRMIFHIFDATTGQNPEYYHSVSVIAPTTEEADGLSTAFFLINPSEVRAKCAKLKTPVLLYTVNGNLMKLCGWEKFEKK
ncbi:FAD:protein FMN transferase [Seleniivibrio woodruffii]|uniref:FAD:protein FMN transferase n=1 Tax=Seleniivibrio woodruffii TaxID=1078050 RepID=A0A4R1K981_9BACT|nr:FAD:protein FMN transferase [Seleniivibrio woodruffii]TCK60932.1 thiamine biosynthesis lipoprotein [Seleniivibrio woodruffii]TVZ36562.1 thiamine biosynthesis lipoprotein [Seleniivibrio woodruffii]